MQFRELGVPEAFEVTPKRHSDSRGEFSEWFRGDELTARTGRTFVLRQANLSVSHARVARGVHFSDVPPGQAKYVTTLSGSGVDFVVDLREGSARFGKWDSVRLTSPARNAVFVPEGFGHAFVSLEDDTSLVYLTTDVYRPDRDRSVSLFDPEIGLELPHSKDDLILSDKDLAAPSLSKARSLGILPSLESCVELDQGKRS